MKNSIGQNNVLAKVNKVKDAQILMLDDIGADSMSSWIRDEVLGVILQYRMQEKLPTFFSSNFSMKELEQHLAYQPKRRARTREGKEDHGTCQVPFQRDYCYRSQQKI
jgi:DNA replication protein